MSSLVEPDGTVRTVKYTADKENGFRAQVFMNGKLVEHGNTSGSDESDEGGYQVYQGAHSIERPTITSINSRGTKVPRSSEEGFGVKSEEDDFEDDDGDDDEDEEED